MSRSVAIVLNKSTDSQTFRLSHKSNNVIIVTFVGLLYDILRLAISLLRPVAMVLAMPAPHGPEDAAPQHQNMFFNVTTHR